MKWETTEEMLGAAKKFADAEDDKAVKSDEDVDYWHHKILANLLKAMSEKIKGFENGKSECSS